MTPIPPSPSESLPLPFLLHHLQVITSPVLINAEPNSNPASAIITLVVGKEHRLFAAHESALSLSPFFQAALIQNAADGNPTRRIALPDEEPEIFSSVLEFLYKGDYYPRLVHSKRRNSWELEPPVADRAESTVFCHSVDGELLKDTVIYCAGEKYGLEDLKKISLRKQGLREFSPFSL